MRKVAKLIALILLVIGTIGLLANEFVAEWGRGVTITFACLNVLGFGSLSLLYLLSRYGVWYSK